MCASVGCKGCEGRASIHAIVSGTWLARESTRCGWNRFFQSLSVTERKIGHFSQDADSPSALWLYVFTSSQRAFNPTFYSYHTRHPLNICSICVMSLLNPSCNYSFMTGWVLWGGGLHLNVSVRLTQQSFPNTYSPSLVWIPNPWPTISSSLEVRAEFEYGLSNDTHHFGVPP